MRRTFVAPIFEISSESSGFAIASAECAYYGNVVVTGLVFFEALLLLIIYVTNYWLRSEAVSEFTAFCCFTGAAACWYESV